MKIVNVPQGTEEWKRARLGRITASEADALLTPSFDLRKGKGTETYLYRKLAEKFLGYQTEDANTFAMDQGQMAEKLALPWFNFTYNADARAVGFCETDDSRCGCSPDALWGNDNGLEIKFPTPPVHLRYLCENVVPEDYRVQVAFSMWVTNRPKWTFISFSRQFPPLVIHVERNEAVQDQISEAVRSFYARFDPIYNRLVAERDAENAVRRAEYEKTNP